MPKRRNRNDSEERSALSSAHEDSSFESNEFQVRRHNSSGRFTQLFRSLPSRMRRQRNQIVRATGLTGLVGTVQSSPFQCYYWRHLRQIDKPSSCWFRAPSSVKEVIYFQACNWSVLVCAGGDIVALVNDPVTPRVAWSGRVLMTGPDGTVARASSSVKLKRAAFDTVSERIYFTQTNHAGIFYSRLGEIRSSVVYQPKIFVIRNKNRDHFGAIAVDSRQSLLICCNSRKSSASITFWSTDHKAGDCAPLAEIPCNSLLMPTGPAQRELLSIRPHKCATFTRVDNTGTSTLVAVCDKANSAVFVFRANLTPQNSVKFDYVATVASENTGGDIRRPRAVHFDPAGNLIIADDGPFHSRLLFYPLTDRGFTEGEDDQILTSSIYRSVFAPIKCLAASLEPTSRRPFILSGVSGFLRFPGLHRLGTSGEVACFAFDDE